MHGSVYDGVTQLVDHTPIVRLARPGEAVIPAQVELFDPGGSVKDRIGLAMFEDGERDGRLRPGMTVVEPTSGNTGVALALVRAVKGDRCVLIPGLGPDLVPKTLDREIHDEVVAVADMDTDLAARELARKEGPLVGVSSGAAPAAARAVARRLGPGRTVLTLLPDTGERYWSSFAALAEELNRGAQP